jgi:hypothetical protein
MQAVHDLAANLVHLARSSDVRTTIVDEGGHASLERSHGNRLQDYDT